MISIPLTDNYKLTLAPGGNMSVETQLAIIDQHKRTADAQTSGHERVVMQKHIEPMENFTDLYPWYWMSYGDKCYAFAVAEAYQLNEDDPLPEPGTRLEFNQNGEWAGQNGTVMVVNQYIAEIEQQNGDTICSFIAAAHSDFIRRFDLA